MVCTLLPEDPYEFMMNHVVPAPEGGWVQRAVWRSHRPAPPPAEAELCGSGALWVLLREGDLQCSSDGSV